jgi:hypothetical protein
MKNDGKGRDGLFPRCYLDAVSRDRLVELTLHDVGSGTVLRGPEP